MTLFQGDDKLGAKPLATQPLSRMDSSNEGYLLSENAASPFPSTPANTKMLGKAAMLSSKPKNRSRKKVKLNSDNVFTDKMSKTTPMNFVPFCEEKKELVMEEPKIKEVTINRIPARQALPSRFKSIQTARTVVSK